MRLPDWQSDDGAIRLYHGDCLELLPTIPAGMVDAAVTDPPWNCGYFGDTDEESWPAYCLKLKTWKDAAERVASGQAWFLSTKSIAYVSGLFAGYMPFASIKNFSQMTPHRLPNCWDIAFIKSTGYMGNGRNWFLCNTAGMLLDRTEHPTPRTVDVMRYVMDMHDWPVILDPFMGSGTTGVACVRTGRRFIGVELERKYFDIAVKRIERELAQPKLPFAEQPKEVQAEIFA